MLARIYIPAQNAMQSGKANSKEWLLEFEPASASVSDPLMGWTVSSDMNGQVRMMFDTQAEAVAYAQRHGIAFEVLAPKQHRRTLKAYADNFAFGRRESWTH
jgi:hypothetical protein